MNANPDTSVYVAFHEDRDFKRKLIIWGIRKCAPRIEATSRSSTDKTPSPKLAGQIWLEDARRNGSILKRGRVVVQLDECRKSLANLGKERPQLGNLVLIEIDRDSSWH